MLCVTGIPDAATRNVEETAQEDEFGAKDYRSTLELKKDHNSRPLWVVGCLLGEKYSERCYRKGCSQNNFNNH